MRKRLITGFTTTLLFGLAACGGGGGEADTGTVTLSYGVWDANQVPAMEQVAQDFEAAHPDVRVKIQVTPYDQYWTKLQAAASGGSAPDVFWMNGPNFQLYASNGVLAPVSGIDPAAYPEALVDLYSLDGEEFGVPKDFDTVGLWYNKELFDDAGIDYPDASWTWDDLEAAATKLTDPAQGTYGIAAPMDGQQNYYNTIAQAGGTVVSEDGTQSGFDDPGTIEGLRFWVDLIEQGLSPTQQQMTDTAPLQLFESGKVAMFYGGSWNAVEFAKNAYTKERADVAPLPAGPQGRATIIHGLANVVFADTEHPEEAAEFAAFLGSKEAALTQAETGTAIPAYLGTEGAWVESAPFFDLQVFLDQLADAVPYPVSENTAAWNADEAELLLQAWTGERDVAAVAKELAAAMNADLDKEATN